MAERILYVPQRQGERLVEEVTITFPWQGWQTPAEKRANVRVLHEKAQALGISRVLDISTKSLHPLGQRLSPFNLSCEVQTPQGNIRTSYESLWNGSKVLEKGGPFPELFHLPPWESLKDPRHWRRVNGPLIGARLEGKTYEPLSGYDFLYISAAFPILTPQDWMQLSTYNGFTEVTLNPEHSPTCQAGSVALMVALKQRGVLEQALESYEVFKATVTQLDTARYAPPEPAPGAQLALF
ncbi:DarT1-associated NADAR antitoxin family protein [Oecophyllibacter saccharovorans]|uniref:DarT1-associated NADAR antitoxin family protein n=1 Tax=Oecophyllibacter saccharovorans TaxID=2558360 RepID=UPI00114454B5|nr:hypothetical protein [Oecophyllibacter saccharovorans]QDH14868.1 hypothetical protein E3E11_02210 [Oecophyllibacter saccharovorans]TPW35059.1 hypothetical protein E3203_06155 [Oecophyllibacter saccharovorans]